MDPGYLLNPYNDHLMPGGPLLTSLQAPPGRSTGAWPPPFSLGLQGLASVAALWMLGTLFGVALGILAPLGGLPVGLRHCSGLPVVGGRAEPVPDAGGILPCRGGVGPLPARPAVDLAAVDVLAVSSGWRSSSKWP